MLKIDRNVKNANGGAEGLLPTIKENRYDRSKSPPNRPCCSTARPPQLSDFRLRRPRSRRRVPGRFCFACIIYRSIRTCAAGWMIEIVCDAGSARWCHAGESVATVIAFEASELLGRRHCSCATGGVPMRCRIARTCASSIRRSPGPDRLGVLGMPGFTAYGGLRGSVSPLPGKRW